MMLSLNIPEIVVQQIRDVAHESETSDFVLEAIKQQIIREQEAHKKRIEAAVHYMLEEFAEEDLAIAKRWEHIQLSEWD